MTKNGIGLRITGPIPGGWRSNQRDASITGEEATNEIVYVPLEAAVTVKGINGSGQDRDTQRMAFTPSASHATSSP
jgi:hypothetical protein